MRTFCAIAVAVGLCQPLVAAADTVRQIPLPTRDIAFDRVSGKIYASVPSSGGSLGNTITVIDPATGVVGPSVFVGSEPGKIAISDDGQFLYVALDGAAAVRRVSLATLTADLQFGLGADQFFGPFYAEDMAVLPGSPHSVAVSRRNVGFSPRHEGVAIYDSGVQRPTTTPRHTGSNVIEFGTGASTLYGYNNETTDYGFRRMTVSASGVAVVDSTSNVISGFSVDFEMGGTRAYATNGRVIETSSVSIAGTFAGVPASGALVEPDSAAGRTFFLAGSSLLVFDNTTFVPIAASTVPGMVGTPSSLVRWGTRGVAFRTSGNQVFLIDTVLVSCVPPNCHEPRLDSVPYDVDGDGKADVAIYRQSTGGWYVLRSSDSTLMQTAWGCPSCLDAPVTADYDGDGKSDVGVYRASTGEWFLSRSGGGSQTIMWGCPSCGDVPVPGDYDGDGRADIAVYRQSTGQWFINRSGGGGLLHAAWGCPSCGDLPVAADYDDDGNADFAVYRSSTGEWFIHRSGGGGLMHADWGCPSCNDLPVPGDYDGDGRADVAVYRRSLNVWFIDRSSGVGPLQVSWGCANCGDLPAVADFDGDGKSDIAVYRVTSGQWSILRSNSTPWTGFWGWPGLGDTPLMLSPFLSSAVFLD